MTNFDGLEMFCFDYLFKPFKKRYKKFLTFINDLKYKKIVFKSIQPGEMIWAQMPLCKKELDKIPSGHRIRPYLVLEKDKKYLYAYSCSSKHSKKSNNRQEYCVNNTRYKKIKNSYISLTNLIKIPRSNIKTKFIKLDRFDLQNIEKRLMTYTNHSNRFHIPINLSEGDIISNHSQLHYIYAIDNTNLYTYSIYKKMQQNKDYLVKLTIDHKIYYFDFNHKQVIKKAEKNNIVDIAYKDDMQQVKLAKDSLKPKKTFKVVNIQKRKQNYEFDIGTVFKINNKKIVYLFQCDDCYYGIDMLLYTIVPSIIEIKEMNKYPIVDVLSANHIIKILEFLLLNYIKPTKIIHKLYDEIIKNQEQFEIA